MKRKGLLICTILFFLLINTTYYWEGKIGLLALFGLLALVLSFFTLTILLFRQIFLASKKKFKDRQQNYLILIMTIVLIAVYIFPTGILNFDKLEGENLLVAQKDGVANCHTTLNLKDNNKFKQQNVCFGLTEITGKYKIQGDTIFFEDISYGRDSHEFYQYAVFKNHKNNVDGYKGYLALYKSFSDKHGIPLRIIKNELTNQQCDL